MMAAGKRVATSAAATQQVRQWKLRADLAPAFISDAKSRLLHLPAVTRNSHQSLDRSVSNDGLGIPAGLGHRSRKMEQIELAHLPPDIAIYAAYFADVENASFLREQLLRGNTDFQYAFIDASMVSARAVRNDHI